MQALTPSLFLCYAPADRAAAEAIGSFLQRGCQVRIFFEEGELRQGESLAAKAGEGLMADRILVLFSRSSWPARQPRAEWEDAFVNRPKAEGVRIGFARLDDCAPPPILNPRFELAGLPLTGLRSVKRWVRDGESAVAKLVPSAADLEVLAIAIADRPGCEWASAATAARFVQAFREDFDAVLELRCRGRSLASLAGNLGRQLALRLEGDLASNCRKLAEFCSEHRLLLVLEDVDADAVPEELLFSGRSSVLLCPDSMPSETPSDPLDELLFAFSSASSMEQCSLARQCRRLAHEQGRLAECYELIEQWHAAAEAHSDRIIADESAREMVWILETWGREEEARALDYRRIAESSDQMLLPF